ncbi:MAG: alpha/beta hydrolase [Lachnospiraceae bacterium]|nr:alpha/beta hydrolase [Lachnospiraceae bacterium]
MAILDKRLDKFKDDEALNLGLMSLIRKVHGLVENNDIGKHRQSQNQLGVVFGNNKDIQITDVSIDGMAAEWVSVTRAHMKKTVIFYCHGGGFSTGSRLYARTLTTKLAASTSMDVLCFDYRLAPEHPYPAACEDAERAWDYLMLLGYGARDIIVAGDSAGGNLALTLVLKLKSQGRLLPRGLVLMSPWTDMTMAGKSYDTKAKIDPVLSKEYIKTMIDNYLCGGHAIKEPHGQATEPRELIAQEMVFPAPAVPDLTDPTISPLFGDFTGFPPTCIQVGENEILLNDATSLYKKLLKADVPARIAVQKGMWHVYQMSPFRVAYDAMERNAEFIFDICR